MKDNPLEISEEVAIDLAEQYQKKNTNEDIELDLFIAQSWDKSYFLCSV